MNKFSMISAEQAQEDVMDTQWDKLPEVIKMPERATKKSAGYDIFLPYDIKLAPNEDIKIPTFLNVSLDDGVVLLIAPRSGLGFKYYCRLSNTLGVIDGDYISSDNEGHIWVKIRNEGTKTMELKAGQAFCQALFIPFLLQDGDDFENGNTRNGGFGSTTK